MNPVVVPTSSRLRVTYSFHEAPHPVSERVAALHHGICHTREQFQRLIKQLNELGVHAAMIDQQSEHAGFWRNAIGARQYRENMAAAVRAIEQDTQRKIGSYALHSMGALIGEEMQRRHPDLRRPTVLMAPIPICGAWPISVRILKRRPRDYFKAAFALDIHSLVDSPEEVRELFFDAHTPSSIIEETTPQLKHAPFWMYCQLTFRWFLRPWIFDDGQPKLLLYSETDEIFHVREYRATLRRYSKLERYLISGGHDFFIEHAAETARRIAHFHKRHAADDQAGAAPVARPHFLDRRGATDSAEQARRTGAEQE